jgi:hypothetical protein
VDGKIFFLVFFFFPYWQRLVLAALWVARPRSLPDSTTRVSSSCIDDEMAYSASFGGRVAVEGLCIMCPGRWADKKAVLHRREQSLTNGIPPAAWTVLSGTFGKSSRFTYFFGSALRQQWTRSGRTRKGGKRCRQNARGRMDTTGTRDCRAGTARHWAATGWSRTKVKSNILRPRAPLQIPCVGSVVVTTNPASPNLGELGPSIHTDGRRGFGMGRKWLVRLDAHSFTTAYHGAKSLK